MTFHRRLKRKIDNPKNDPRLVGGELKFDGRTIVLTVTINTDRAVEAVAQEIIRCGRGPEQDMCTITGYEMDKAEAEQFWSDTFTMTEKAVAKEN